MVRGNDYTGPRPHVQGSAAALRVRGGGGRITDAGGLVVVRKLWDALGLGGWIDRRSGNVPGRYRPSLIGRVVGGAAPVRRRGDGRPAASGAAGRAPHLRLGAGAAPGHVRALAAVLGRGDVPPARRAAVADGAAALGAGRRGAPVGDDRHGLDRRGALRAEAGRGGAGLQPEEARPPLAPPPSGLRPGDGRLPRRALAACSFAPQVGCAGRPRVRRPGSWKRFCESDPWKARTSFPASWILRSVPTAPSMSLRPWCLRSRSSLLMAKCFAGSVVRARGRVRCSLRRSP